MTATITQLQNNIYAGYFMEQNLIRWYTLEL